MTVGHLVCCVRFAVFMLLRTDSHSFEAFHDSDLLLDMLGSLDEIHVLDIAMPYRIGGYIAER